jgi:putative CocE/NonD family hydrolase
LVYYLYGGKGVRLKSQFSTLQNNTQLTKKMAEIYQVNKKTVSMLTRDGVRLDADVYYPQSREKFPVLLMRQPYGREIASTVVYAHPRWYAAQGYIVVIQDVRGRGTSAGKFELFSSEIEDGEDAVGWASQLEGSTGEVGMYGFSYQGMTQLYALSKQPKALKTICPAMIAYDLYTDWAYENGAFCLQYNLAWAVQLAVETARLKGDITAYQVLHLAAKNLPIYESSSLFKESLRKYAPSNFYYQWLNHNNPGEYWEKLSPQNLIKDADLPMLHIGGWFDPHLRGTVKLYQELAQRSSYPQHLIIGPWAHLPWGRKLGEKDYGKEAISPVDRLQIQWFNKFLKAIDCEPFTRPPVCLFEINSNRWGYFGEYPKSKQETYYLKSSGLASIREDGKLVKKEIETITPAEDILVHDPWRPVPVLGGHGTILGGSFDRSTLDCRSDILTYTSDSLTEDLHIVGDIAVDIYCDTDAASYDLCAVLSEVQTDGKVYNFSQGYKRIDDKEWPVRIPLQPTCIKIPQGNALRLSISGACFPAYPVNAGTGKSSSEAGVMDNQIITLRIGSGVGKESKVSVNLDLAPSRF